MRAAHLGGRGKAEKRQHARQNNQAKRRDDPRQYPEKSTDRPTKSTDRPTAECDGDHQQPDEYQSRPGADRYGTRQQPGTGRMSGTTKAVDRPCNAKIARISIANGPVLAAGNAASRTEARERSPYRVGYGH